MELSTEKKDFLGRHDYSYETLSLDLPFLNEYSFAMHSFEIHSSSTWG